MVLDPIAALVAEFVGRTGATDTAGLYDLAEYLVDESLWSNFVIYPMKSSQNVGSGSTVEPFGGLTSNDMTLVNSPTWGTGGIAFASASSHGASVSDFLGSGNVYAFDRMAMTRTTSSAIETVHSQYSSTDNMRSWWTRVEGTLGGNDAVLLVSSDGTAGTTVAAYGGSFWMTTDDVTYMSLFTGDGKGEFRKEATVVLPLTSITGSRYDSTANILLEGAGDPVRRAFAVVFDVTLTETQITNMRDLINAL